jgi:hypothetical protein
MSLFPGRYQQRVTHSVFFEIMLSYSIEDSVFCQTGSSESSISFGWIETDLRMEK